MVLQRHAFTFVFNKFSLPDIQSESECRSDEVLFEFYLALATRDAEGLLEDCQGLECLISNLLILSWSVHIDPSRPEDLTCF